MQPADKNMSLSPRRIAMLLTIFTLLFAAPAQANMSNPDFVSKTGTSTPTNANAAIVPIPNAEWAAIVAAGVWHKGCPATQAHLRRVEVNFHGFDGAIHRGALVVRVDVASSVARIFTRLFAVGFPIRRMVPIEAYHGDDNASMAADNTSAFNCRTASQANAPAASSPHANGRAVDVNPYENPWVDPRCKCFRPDTKYAGLGKTVRSGSGVITKGSVAWKAFTSEGWLWQDNSMPDYQHFDTGYPSRPLPAKPFPVNVAVGDSSQIITVKASGTTATVTAWTKSTNVWKASITTSSAHIGSKGIADGATRRQNTYTTPSGTYTITQAFGLLGNPGTVMPYHVITKDDWWVEDNNSAFYNTMRTASLGGFNTLLPESDVNGSEHLITHTGLYDYAVVIDYNMNPSVPYRGAGIFLHVSDGQPTAGCVSVPKSTLVAILKWLNPASHPLIVIS
jgi:L,D-peptidoglycan transpeptidase YkuD (ErfK/YbiS/YcfS/YnhG family)